MPWAYSGDKNVTGFFRFRMIDGFNKKIKSFPVPGFECTTFMNMSPD
jgi:hypothetical protein